MNVADLKDKELDFWVARASGIDVHPHPSSSNDSLIVINEAAAYGFYTYAPSRSWRQGGPIIEREKITIQRIGQLWEATKDTYRFTEKSLLAAAMKCFIASKFGENLPEEKNIYVPRTGSGSANASQHW